MRLLNSTYCLPRELTCAAINTFCAAYKVSAPKIKKASKNCVIYAWESIDYFLEVTLTKETFSACIYSGKEIRIRPLLQFVTEYEVKEAIVNLLEYWFKTKKP